jgi:S1-C subfamily serine protease
MGSELQPSILSTVTPVLSAKEENPDPDSDYIESFIQTDAAQWGTVEEHCKHKGMLVGITSAILSSSGAYETHLNQ